MTVWQMRGDAANGHPFIAALVISRARGGLPAPGHFDIAKGFGRFTNDPSSPDITESHGAIFAPAVAFQSLTDLAATRSAT